MTVVVDLLGVQNREHGERGIARYVTSLALALERTAPGSVDRYVADLGLPVPGTVEPLVRSGRVRTFDPHRPPDGATGGVFLAGSLFEFQHPLDRALPRWARTPSWRTVTILYDLIPLRFPERYLEHRPMRRRYLARVDVLRSFDHLLAISQSSADDATELLGIPPGRITVIGAGADSRFRPPARPRHLVASELTGEVLGLRPGYVLFPSGIEQRKNIDRLLDAYATLPEGMRRNHQLVLVCKTNAEERRHLAERARDLGIEADLLVTGFVEDQTLVRLYQAAELVVFPSLYEGFGLPVLEARRCGAPAVCGDNSSLREVQPDPTARFDAEDSGAIAAVLHRTLGNEAELERLRSLEVPPFTWEEAAARTAPILALADRRATARPRKPRLAVISPLPPAESGIATYAGRLLGPLAGEADITVFGDTPADGTDAPAGITVRPIEEFDRLERSGGAFDEVVYFLGNSHFHITALQLLRRRPGIVLLHDARLTGLYNVSHLQAPGSLPGRSVGATLAALYPGRYRADIELLDTVDHETAARFGILLTAEVARYATRLLVHSDFAASLVELDTGRRPEVVYPHPVPDIASTTGAPATPAHPVIGSFGIVSPAKHPDLLVEALAHLRTEIPTAELRLVGGVDPAIRQAITEVAVAHGVEGAVTFTGHVDDDRFLDELRDVTLAVQLRATTNGESSGVVADAMAAGVPTVVSDLGTMGELPAEAVEKVPVDVDGPTLGRILVSLLNDPARRRAMVGAGTRYATANRYDAAARVLLETVLGRR